MLRIATLPLTDVEVVVSDFPQVISDYAIFDEEIVDPPRDLSVLWTAEDRMECAERIRKTLLDPKGAEIFAEVQELLQNCRRIVKEVRRNSRPPGMPSKPRGALKVKSTFVKKCLNPSATCKVRVLRSGFSTLMDEVLSISDDRTKQAAVVMKRTTLVPAAQGA